MKNPAPQIIAAVVEFWQRPFRRVRAPQLRPEPMRAQVEEMLREWLSNPEAARRLLQPLVGTVFPIQGGVCSHTAGEIGGGNTAAHEFGSGCDAGADFYFGGKVGIGTNSPGVKFEVNASGEPVNIGKRGGSASDSYLYFNVNGWSGMGAYKGNFSGPADLVLQVSGGKVGVGTTSPASPFDVNSSLTNEQLHVSRGTQYGYLGAGGANTEVILGAYDSQYGFQTLSIQPTGGKVGIGTTSPSEKLEVAGNVKAEGFLGPLTMMLTQAAFSLAAGEDIGSASFAAGDGCMEAQTGTTPNSHDETVGGIINRNDLTQTENLTTGLSQPGAFLGARARWNSAIQSSHQFYILVGGVGGGAFLQSGFGFKAEGSALKGVTMLNGTQTVVDLATSLTSGAFVELFAVRRGSSVEFYVEGVLKASSSTNLPSSAASTYEVRTENGASGGNAVLQVGYLTVQLPT